MLRKIQIVDYQQSKWDQVDYDWGFTVWHHRASIWLHPPLSAAFLGECASIDSKRMRRWVRYLCPGAHACNRTALSWPVANDWMLNTIFRFNILQSTIHTSFSFSFSFSMYSFTDAWTSAIAIMLAENFYNIDKHFWVRNIRENILIYFCFDFFCWNDKTSYERMSEFCFLLNFHLL